MRTLAIGDIHGCYTALTTLAAVVRFQPDDRLVVLGDYIDRGPDSRAVIDWMIRQREICSTAYLRGNHEVMILQARDDTAKASFWQTYGGVEALASYGAEYGAGWTAAVPEEHWKFFESTLPSFETPKNIFVHACLDPDLDMADQPDWLLYWEYFDSIKPHKSGKKVICGHSPQRSGQIKDLGFAACIDTWAAMGGWLTCLDVDSGEYWQANQKGECRTAIAPAWAPS